MRLSRFLFSRSSYFITTPIFYSNGAPHIGHLHSAVLADAAHRWHLLKYPHVDKTIFSTGTDEHGGKIEKTAMGMNNPFKTIFSTGTDEHGAKIEKTAMGMNKNVLSFCDEISAKFRTLFDQFNIGYTDFIRTTETRHRRVVQLVWEKLNEHDLIYKASYSGWYSTVDECFYSEHDLIDVVDGTGRPLKVTKNTNTEVSRVLEENYMFRLSRFRSRIDDWLRNADVIQPVHYLSQALQFMDHEEDLSVSRDAKRISWGIPVPGDSSQTIYVWLDALMNYLTVNGYPDNSNRWPPDLQIIGKDILKYSSVDRISFRFHAIYWPAFLMALELDLPKKIFVHGHWLVDHVKMSKSVGNVIDPFSAAEILTVDGLRYYLLKHGVPQDDNDFTMTKAMHTINADLVNNLSNLVSRATANKVNKAQWYPLFDEKAFEGQSFHVDLVNEVNGLRDHCSPFYDRLLFYRALEKMGIVADLANSFFQHQAPWRLEPGPKLDAILNVTYETCRITAILLQPIVPDYADRLLSRLGIPVEDRQMEMAIFGAYSPSERRQLGSHQGVLFPRIETLLKAQTVL